MSTDQKKRSRLANNAVERVRDFAYTEPHAAAPTRQPLSELRWGAIRPRNRAPGCALRAGRGHIPVSFIADKRRSDARYRVRERPPHHEIGEQARANAIQGFRQLEAFPGWALPPIKKAPTIRANFLA